MTACSIQFAVFGYHGGFFNAELKDVLIAKLVTDGCCAQTETKNDYRPKRMAKLESMYSSGVRGNL